MLDKTETDGPASPPPDRRTDAPRRPANDATRPARRTGARLLLTLIACGLLGYGGYAGREALIAAGDATKKRPIREKVFNIATVPVTFASYQPDLALYGETVAGRKVELRSLVAGTVLTVGDAMREGGVVAKGETLLAIDAFDFKGALTEAEARLAEARGRLTELEASLKSDRDSLPRDRQQRRLAQKDVDRTVPLVRRKAVTERVLDDRNVVLAQRSQAVEQRENAIRVRAAQIVQQGAAIRRLEWGVAQAIRRVAETTLKAPFNAYVSDVNADVGRLLSANDRVATLLDRDWIEAHFVLTDAQYGRIIAQTGSVIGRPVRLIWRVGRDPIVYKAKIVRVGATISAGQGGIPVFARFDNPLDPTPIRPGAFVEVLTSDQTYRNVARIPQSAVYGSDTVYVAQDGRTVKRKIEIVGGAGSDVLVRGELRPGDAVIRTRLSTPGEGLKVFVPAVPGS